MAVKSGKGLTAREIRGKKKHKILWCMRNLEGYFAAGNAPFVSGCTLVKSGAERQVGAGRRKQAK